MEITFHICQSNSILRSFWTTDRWNYWIQINLDHLENEREEGEKELSSHEGEEFIYVLEGQIEVIYGKDTFTIEEGDSIFYDSVVPHHLHASGEKASKILAVLYTPY